MTPTRFRECLDALHWTQRGLARILGRPEGTVRQWARGAVRIPDDVAAWLEQNARFMQSAPVPRRDRMPLGDFTAGARLADQPDQRDPERASVNTVQGVFIIRDGQDRATLKGAT